MSTDEFSDKGSSSSDESINLDHFPKVLPLRDLTEDYSDTDTDYSQPERNNSPLFPVTMDLAESFRELALSIKTNRHHSELQPDPFKGLPNEDFDLFLQKFTQWCDFLDKSVDERRQFLPFFLKDNAYEKYSRFTDEVKEDYPTLIRLLQHTFASSEFLILDSTKFHSLKMGVDDSVTSFYDKVMKQSKRLDVTAQQRMAVFVNGLPSEIKEFVLLQNPTTMDQAFRLAKTKQVVSTNTLTLPPANVLNKILDKLDNVSKPHVETTKSALNTSAVSFKQDDVSTRLDSLEHLLNNIYHQLSTINQPIPPAPLAPSNQDHHFFPYNRPPPPATPRLQNSRKTNQNVQCFGCQNFGHVKKFCPYLHPSSPPHIANRPVQETFPPSSSSEKNIGNPPRPVVSTINIKPASMFSDNGCLQQQSMHTARHPSFATEPIRHPLASVNSQLMMSGFANGVETDFFLDTGSTISILSLEYVNYLGLTPTQNDSIPPISSVNGSQEPILGSCYVTVSFGNFRAPVKFYVVRHAIAHVILGMDFATQHVRMINLFENMVALNHPFAKLNTATRQFEVSSFGHFQPTSRPHMKLNSVPLPPPHQEINKLSHNNRLHTSSKRNFHPSMAPPTPLMDVRCPIPLSFCSPPSSSQPSLPRKHRRNSTSRPSYSSCTRDGRTLNRNVNLCANKFRNFKGRLSHFQRRPLIPLFDCINDDHSPPLLTHYAGRPKSNSIAYDAQNHIILPST